MSKKTKSFINISEALKKQDDWLQNTNAKFKCGDVVERVDQADQLGVVCFPLHEIETYKVKWYKGPKPWDFIEGTGKGSQLKLSDKPNPLIYKHSDRFPGPSSTQINKLNEVFNKDLNKPKTGKEVDQHIAILEEELSKNKIIVKKKEEVEYIVNEEDEDNEDVPAIVDSVEIKRKKLIEEE